MRLTDSVSLVGGGRLGPGLSNAYDSNVYLVRTDDGAWLIDAGSGLEPDRILANATVAADGRELTGVAVTHAHADHAGGARAFADRGLRVVSGARTVALIRTGRPPRTRSGRRATRRRVPRRLAPRTGHRRLRAGAAAHEHQLTGGPR